MQILSRSISALNVRESPKFSRPIGNRVEEHDGDVRFRTEMEIRQFCACAIKNTQYNAYGRIAEILAS